MNRTALLLLLALVSIQALGVAHAFDYAMLDHGSHACAVCTHGGGLDQMPAPAVPAYVVLHVQPAVPEVQRPAATAFVAPGYNSRAPPRFPA